MLDISKCAAYFLAKHAFGPDGCYFLVERDGTPKEQFPGIGLSPSTLADAFVVLGLSGYAAAAGDIALLDKAIELFYKVEQKAGDKTFRTAPYIVEPGMYMSMIPMYIINLTNELHRACVALNDSRAGIIERFAKKYCDIVFNKCARPDGLILEQFDVDFNTVDSFLGRYSNPGHSVESGWFALESCAKRGDKEGIARAVTIIEKAFDSGKDAEHGGILYYVDLDGLQPRGPVVTEADAKAKPQYDKDWSNKLWWPHTEMLYGLMLAYAFTGKDSLLDKFEELHEYTFKTFPNPDESIGEWIQLRDRRGEPISNEVGGRLPVKDPYHANRNFIMLIELLDAMTMSEEE